MYLLLAAVCFGIAVFCVLTGLLRALGREKIELAKRLEGIRREEEETPAAERDKKKTRVKKEKRARNAVMQKFLRKLEDELYDNGLRIEPMRFMELWIGITIGIPLLLMFFGLNTVFSVLAAVLCAFGPILYVNMRRSSRRKKLEEQMIETITILCGALRAGHSFQSAMERIASEMEAPISEEFGRVFRETLHGVSIEDSLKRMVERVGSSDLSLFYTAVATQREVGGNLAEVMENIAGTIQSRVSLRAEIKTRTSSGRISGYLIGALPILLLVVLSFVNPDYTAVFYHERVGYIMLGVCVAMELIGFVVIKKITTIKY